MTRIRGDRLLVTLHLLSIAVLLFHYHRYVSGLVSAVFFTVAVVAALAASVGTERAGLRFPVALAAAAAAVWLVHAGGIELLSRAQSAGPADGGRGVTAAFDRGVLASAPAMLVAFITTFAVLRRPALFAWHPLVLLPVVVALFWSQGHFNVTLFAHPSMLAASVTVFVLLEIVLTAAATLRRRGGAGLGRRELLPIVVLVLPLLLGSLLLLLGRYSEASTAQGSGLIRPTLFRFDFRDYVNLESEISLSRDLVLLYREQSESEQQQLTLRSGRRLLRRFVLSGYDPGRGFFAESSPGQRPAPSTVGEGAVTLPRRDYAQRSEVTQEYYLVNFDPSSLVSVNYPVSIVPFETWTESSFARIYEVTSRASDAGPEALLDAEVPRPSETSGGRADGTNEVRDAEWYRYYTDDGGDEALRRLAADITQGIEGDYAKARAIEQYFLEEYFYSLRPGVAADGNQLHHFLFESRKGYCSYFAFSMTLMARSLGLPARVAVGFFVNPQMSVMGYHAVRADMAHAWVEVYFEDYGWIEFDPTSTTMAPGEQYTMNPNLDMDQLSRLLEELMNHRDELRRAGPAPGDSADGGAREARGVDAVLRFAVQHWPALLLLLYLLSASAYRFVPRLRAAAARDYRNRTKLRFKALLRELDAVGLRKSHTETVFEYASRMELTCGVGAEECAVLYLKALFGEAYAETDYRRYVAEEQDARAGIRRQVAAWRRVLAFLVPFVKSRPALREHEPQAGGTRS